MLSGAPSARWRRPTSCWPPPGGRSQSSSDTEVRQTLAKDPSSPKSCRHTAGPTDRSRSIARSDASTPTGPHAPKEALHGSTLPWSTGWFWTGWATSQTTASASSYHLFSACRASVPGAGPLPRNDADGAAPLFSCAAANRHLPRRAAHGLQQLLRVSAATGRHRPPVRR